MEELFNTHSTKIQDIVGQIQMINKEKECSKGANRNEVQQLLLDVRKLSNDHKILEVDMKQTREAYIDINKKIRDLERIIQKDVKELHTAFKQRLKQEKQKDTSSTDQFEEIIITKKPEEGIYSQKQTPEINTKLDKRPLQNNANLQNIQTREKKTHKTRTGIDSGMSNPHTVERSIYVKNVNILQNEISRLQKLVDGTTKNSQSRKSHTTKRLC